MPRTPNLFLVGAMKSGTSSLHNHLGSHPEIFMSPVKEPSHFTTEGPRIKSREAYLRLFADASGERWVGESSTNYSKRPSREGVVERLHRFAPQARILYLMRDPFDRILSQYKHMVRHGIEYREIDRIGEGVSDYLWNSYYAYQLEPYLRLFGRDRVFSATLERFENAPQPFLEELFSWLGVDPTHAPPQLRHRFHEAPGEMALHRHSAFGSRAFRYMRRLPGGGWGVRACRRLLPSIFIEQVRIDATGDEFAEGVDRLRNRIGPLLARMVQELAALTGQSYEEWPSAAHPPTGWEEGAAWVPPALIDRIRRHMAVDEAGRA